MTATGARSAIEATRRLMREHPRLTRAGAGALVLAVLAVRDPHRPIGPLRCPVKLVTGLDCPGCGGGRMTHDLLHGDLGAAVHDNPFLLVFGPVLAAFLVRGRGSGAGRWAEIPAPVAYGLGGAAFGWMALRNLPRWPLKPTSA